MLRRLRDDDGVSTLELAWVLPILLLVLSIVLPSLGAGLKYMTLSRATASGIRYATKVDANARESAVGLTRRPTAAEVDTFVREAAQPLDLQSVDVSPEPAGALPGEAITVTVSHEVSFGPLASLANSLSSVFFGGGELLPETTTVTVSARGRQE